MCGGSPGLAGFANINLGSIPGLSPRVRGKRLRPGFYPGFPGSIPACAGEAAAGCVIVPTPKVYPRVCGGSAFPPDSVHHEEGLSPRVRGKLHPPAEDKAAQGSIPACAGEAFGVADDAPGYQVYPRVCGGSPSAGRSGPLPRGLSPRVRGKRRRIPDGWDRIRSIPRVRGKRFHSLHRAGSARSIPACAGEASSAESPPPWIGVYPRVCGGSPVTQEVSDMADGLSPRVRGKRSIPGRHRPSPGSIPACAGEATGRNMAQSYDMVYPRVCGGSHRQHRLGPGRQGLSPRVRGKPLYALYRCDDTRSIPACAGEARPDHQPAGRHGVYPRVCGGSRRPACVRIHPPGLSPRVRGKRRRRQRRYRRAGSIPACAGEAGRHHPGAGRAPVYPRVCGGSPWPMVAENTSVGLSPRVRGKPDRLRRSSRRARSIPACAGEAPGHQ